jgi:DNA-binding GntR family transcriptional regulator
MVSMKTELSMSGSNGKGTPPASQKAEGSKRPQIVRGTLHDEVVAVLRDMIIQDELHPGSRIPEAELCTQLGISRTPLREALRVLASEGLVKPLPRRGAIVAEPTPDEIQGLFYAIGSIESTCAQLACVNFTDLEIENVLKLHKRLVQLYARGQPSKDYFRTNQAIHQAIVLGARNQFLVELHNSLSLRVLRVRFFIDVSKSAWKRALAEHEQIAALVQRRDGRKLSELLLRHMIGSWRDYEVTLDRPKLAKSYLSR